jgi:hypothetical protein
MDQEKRIKFTGKLKNIDLQKEPMYSEITFEDIFLGFSTQNLNALYEILIKERRLEIEMIIKPENRS